MDQQTFGLGDSQPESIRRTCPKCGYIRETSEKHCAECGRLLQSVSTIRIIGVVLVVLGCLLLGFMGWLSLWMYGTISNTGNPSSGSHFNGSANDIVFIVFILGLVTSISLGVTVAGIWQIIFGKRNKVIVFAVAALGIVFVLTGLMSIKI